MWHHLFSGSDQPIATPVTLTLVCFQGRHGHLTVDPFNLQDYAYHLRKAL